MKTLTNRINRNFAYVGILVLFTAMSLMADWPRHRGDAALKGNANSQLGKQLDLLWTYNTGEFLKSSVVAQNGVAFVGSEEGLLHAILLESGEKKWTFKTEMAIEAPPLLHEGQVIVGSTDGFLYSINQDSGKLNWKYETMGEIMGAANQAIRPQSKDDVLVVGSYDNFVHCVETKSGKLLWKFEAQNYINGVPTIYDRKYVVFGGCDAMLYVIGLEDGKDVRSIEVEAPIAASVAIADGVGYVGDMDRSVTAFNLEAGEILWNYKPKSFPYFSSPALSDNHVYIGGRDKGMHCIDRVSGSNFGGSQLEEESTVPQSSHKIKLSLARWMENYMLFQKDGNEISSYEMVSLFLRQPAIVGTKIIVGCEDGNVYAFETVSKERNECRYNY